MQQIVSYKTKLLKPFVTFLFLLTFLLNVKGQAVDYKSVAGKTYGERQLFLFNNFYGNQKLRADSTRYFQEVAKLSKVANQTHDEELMFEADFLKYNFLSSRNYANYLPEIKALLKKVDNKEITQLQARVRQAIGLHYYYEKNNFGEAYIYLTDSYDYIKELSLKELPDKQELLYNIGFLNYNIGYEFKALKYLEEAEVLENKYYLNLDCNIINTKGLIYEHSGDLDKALLNFSQVLEISKEIKNDIWVRVAKNNIAQVLLNQKKYDETLTFLNGYPNLKYSQSEETGVVETRRLVLLAKTYVAQNRWEELSKITEQLRRLNQTIDIPLRVKRNIYSLLSIDQKQKGNFELAYFYNDTAMVLNNKYYKLKSDEGLRQALEKERIEALLKEQIKTEHQKKITAITRISLLIILGLIIALSLVLFKRQKEIYKKRRQEVESELEDSKEKLTELLNDLKFKNKEVEAYENELEQLYQNFNKDDFQINEKQKTLEILLSKPIMTDSKWVVFKRAFDRIYTDYYLKLNNTIPTISPAEVRYMYLRKLNLTPKEIAFVLGISQASIRQYKHRIRNKIHLDSAQNLDEFLDNI